MNNNIQNQIKVILGEDISFYHDEDDGVWELIQYDTVERGELVLDYEELTRLNKLGLLYQDVQSGIDYEDEDEDGKTIEKYMDVYYFKYYES